MKQVLQQYKSGVSVEEVPPPDFRGEGVIVRNFASLISAGTERMTLELSQKSLLTTARERPDLVRRVIRMFQTRGWRATLDTVKARLKTTSPLGYSCAGEVFAVSPGTSEFSVGDRVACAGATYANHAEIVFIPKNLCARIPDGVSYEDASYVTLGAIAMQGVRQADVRVGENIVVIGLGLIGQLTVQILKANGARVVGIDLDKDKTELALKSGADMALVRSDDVIGKVGAFTDGHGADAVIITAATQSNDPVELAGEISRERGKVVALGAIGLNIPRSTYYNKELDLRLSRSYGPGRYDPVYEQEGQDYPYPYVRWTEKRNMESFLQLIAEKKINISLLTTHRFPIESAEKAYALLTGQTKESYLGIVLTYDTTKQIETKVAVTSEKSAVSAPVAIGFVGVGNFARSVLLPAIRELAHRDLRAVADADGLVANRCARDFGFAYATSNYKDALADKEINTIIIATRHNLHAPIASEALRAGKNVFVEKPLALNDKELKMLRETAKESRGILMVGFNRRFSPAAQEIRKLFEGRREPLHIIYRVNAGFIPKTHWVQSPREGGGRIIGEVCHFIDFVHFITGAKTLSVYARSINSKNQEFVNADTVSIILSLADGSTGAIHYLANGPEGISKERIEVFGEGKYAFVDDFRSITLSRGNKTSAVKFPIQDKGHKNELRLFFDAVKNGLPSPIPLEDSTHTTKVSFRILDSLATDEKTLIESEF